MALTTFGLASSKVQYCWKTEIAWHEYFSGPLVKIDDYLRSVGDFKEPGHLLDNHLLTYPLRHPLNMITNLISYQETGHSPQFGFRFTHFTQLEMDNLQSSILADVAAAQIHIAGAIDNGTVSPVAEARDATG